MEIITNLKNESNDTSDKGEFDFVNCGSASQDEEVKREFDFVNCGSDFQSEIDELSVVSYIGEGKEFSVIYSNPWPSSSWSVGSRRSAFQPYKPTTVLTNLQRGNTKTETLLSDINEITWYEQAGLGDLTVEQTKEAGYHNTELLNTSIELDTPDENGLSALMWAAFYGQTRTVKLLVSAGADVNHIGTSGETALLLAATGGHLDIIRSLLLHNADVNHEDFTGSTALMYAAYGDHPHAVNELLLHGGRFTTVNNDGDTAYTIAIKRDCCLALPVLESHLVGLLSNDIS